MDRADDHLFVGVDEPRPAAPYDHDRGEARLVEQGDEDQGAHRSAQPVSPREGKRESRGEEERARQEPVAFVDDHNQIAPGEEERSLGGPIDPQGTKEVGARLGHLEIHPLVHLSAQLGRAQEVEADPQEEQEKGRLGPQGLPHRARARPAHGFKRLRTATRWATCRAAEASGAVCSSSR